MECMKKPKPNQPVEPTLHGGRSEASRLAVRAAHRRRWASYEIRMHIRTITWILAFLVSTMGLAGCASNPDVGSLSSEQRTRMSSIEMLRGPTSRPHTVLKSVKGISCHRNAYQQQLLTETEAIEGVKLKAALLDADAVVNTVCQTNSGTDWVNNCWASIVCVGDAVQYTQ